MSKMKYLVIHCSDSPFNREVTADDIFKWHLGPKKNKDGSYIFRGKKISTLSELRNYKLELPSGKVISASSIVGRGWKQVGYSDMIQRSGELVNLVPYTFDDVVNSFEITNGAEGYNSVSRHIVLAGGWVEKNGILVKNGRVDDAYLRPEELYTKEQIDTLLSYIEMQLRIVPSLIVVGHNQLSKKTCPNFDVNLFLKENKLLSE